jgi:hypothetical protein
MSKGTEEFSGNIVPFQPNPTPNPEIVGTKIKPISK